MGAAVEALTLASSQKGRCYCATKKLQLCYKDATKVLLCYKSATTVLQKCYNCATKMLQLITLRFADAADRLSKRIGNLVWTHSFNCLVDLIESLHVSKLANFAYLAPKFLSQVSFHFHYEKIYYSYRILRSNNLSRCR